MTELRDLIENYGAMPWDDKTRVALDAAILAICEERDRLRGAIAAMRSQVHNLPRCVTADRIDAIAGAALGDGATP